MRAGVLVGVLLSVAVALFGAAQSRPAGSAADWPMYRHDLAGTGLLAADADHSANVATPDPGLDLSPAERCARRPRRRDEAAQAAGVNSQATPIVVSGVMYLPAANRVVALDAGDGQGNLAASGHRRRAVTARRGLLAGRRQHSAAHHLHGRAPADRARRADRRPRSRLRHGRRSGHRCAVQLGARSSIRNVVVVGANTPPGTTGGIGNARAFDARTGAKLWEFSSVPQPGTVGHDTWEGDSWKGRLGANAWPFYFTLDEAARARSTCRSPRRSPAPTAAIARARTCSAIRSSPWTSRRARTSGTSRPSITTSGMHDPPAPPGLFDVVQNGRTIPALGVTTKSGYLYILNRETGQPIFGVEERPVPQSDVPGEQAFPTQPIPVKPPALARVAYTPADLVTAADTTPEHAKACAELVEKIGGVVQRRARSRRGGTAPTAPRPATTLVFPGGLGGANWGGTAFDPDSAIPLRRDPGRRRARLDGEGAGRIARARTRRRRRAAARSTSASATRTGRARNRHGAG